MAKKRKNYESRGGRVGPSEWDNGKPSKSDLSKAIKTEGNKPITTVEKLMWEQWPK